MLTTHLLYESVGRCLRQLVEKTLFFSALCGLLLIFSFTQLNSQVHEEYPDDYSPPHPDSLSDFIEGIDIQKYSGGEAYVIKNNNINLPDAIEFAKSFSDIYGSGNYAVPNGSTMLTMKVFDTSIKPLRGRRPDVNTLPPLAKTADTSLCNQIIWSEPMLLYEGAIFMNISISGDTVHAIADNFRDLPYRRSTNSGIEFEPIRNVYIDTVGRYGGGGWPRILSNGNKVFIIYFEPDAPAGDLKVYFAYTYSKDGGNTFTPSRRIVEHEAIFTDVASSGDTIAVVIGDDRGTRPAPVPKYIYISTNFGETWKFRGHAGGRRVYDPRIALAGGWLYQTNRYFPPGRWTRSEVAYYRSRVMRRSWSRRQVLSTNDGISSIQGDPVAEPNGFVGVIWGDGKYGSKYGWDGTPMFRRSLNYGKTFEPEIRLTDSPEASWGVMKTKSIATKLPVVSAVWCATWENEYETNAIRLSLDGGSSWCPIYYQHMGFGALSPNSAIGNGKIYWAFYNINIGSYFVSGILPGNLKTETAQTIDEVDIEDDQIIQIKNYPNPFNPVTTISYNTSISGYVTLKIYDVLGREVAVLLNNEYKEEGEHEVEFFANDDYTSGIYFYRLSLKNENGIKTKTGKMLLTK